MMAYLLSIKRNLKTFTRGKIFLILKNKIYVWIFKFFFIVIFI